MLCMAEVKDSNGQIGTLFLDKPVLCAIHRQVAFDGFESP